MDGPHRGLRRGNDFDFTVQGLAQTVPTEGSLNCEHGNQEHDDQDHKKNPYHHENPTAEAWVIGNRNRGTAVRTLFQLRVKLPFTLSTPKRFHVKRLTRFIYSGQMDFLPGFLTPTNTGGTNSTPPGRRVPCCVLDPDETGTSHIGCLAVRSRQ